MVVTTQQPVRLASTSGAVTWVYPGSPRELGGELLRMALEAGCVPEGQASATEQVPPTPAALLSTLSKIEQIQGAIQDLIKRNKAEAFTSNGVPRVKDVSALLGYDVNRVEVETAFSLLAKQG
jgi:hypothetical protein